MKLSIKKILYYIEMLSIYVDIILYRGVNNMEEKYNGLKLAERGARISIIAYVALSILKLGVGYLSDSKA